MERNFDNGSITLQTLIENSSWGIMLLDAEMKVIYISATAEKIDGWGLEQRLQNELAYFVHPQDLYMVEVLIKRVVHSSGAAENINFRTKHINGNYIWLHCNVNNMLDNIHVGAIVLSFIDVSAQKATEIELTQQTFQISELLESMNDGFVALDENLRYTYVNERALKMSNRSREQLIGQFIWDVFPDVVGSATYNAIQTAFEQKEFCCNIDFYAPMQLWQENRAYPSAGGVSLFIRDITKQKKEEQHLRLLESVITNTTDAVLITEAEPFELPGPRIIYVNEAFTAMTGYTAAEVIGKTPRILQGPKTDKNELTRLGKCLRNWEVCEATLVNYKKSGEEFWINFALNPVADEKGWFTHWISIERDVTRRKNEELQSKLIAETSQLFNESMELSLTLDNLVEKVVVYDHFKIAEIWLINADSNKITLAAHALRNKETEAFYRETTEVTSFTKKEGLPGAVWDSGSILSWYKLADQAAFVRKDAAAKAGIIGAYGVPLFVEKTVIGVLIIGHAKKRFGSSDVLIPLFEKMSTHFGVEIKRKQLEQELSQIFNLAPDIICVIGEDGYLKKLNPAMSTLFGYSEAELLALPVDAFVHPDEKAETRKNFQKNLDGLGPATFENRFVTKRKEEIWLSWTAHLDAKKGQLFCVAKDISQRKKSAESLRESQSNLEAIFQSSSEGFILIDSDGFIKSFNPVAKDMMRLNTFKEMNLGENIYHFIQSSDIDAYRKTVARVMEGERLVFDKSYSRENGDVKWFAHSINPVFWNGVIKGTTINSVDITERKQAERNLQASESNLLAVIENTDAFIYSLDRDLRYVTYNTKLSQIIFEMYGEKIAPGYPVFDFTNADSPEGFSEWENIYHKALSGEVLKFEKEIFVEKFIIYVSFSIHPIWENEIVIGLSCFVADITQRWVAENKSLTYLKAIEAQNEKLKEISWMQSHVIRIPLARILGLVPLIGDTENLPVETKQMLDYLVSSALELDVVIREITDKTGTISPSN